MNTEPYRPSNGTEGEIFRANWCDLCERDRYERKPCRILTLTMAYDVDDIGYPKQWLQTADVDWLEREPRCTSFRPIVTKTRPRSRRVRDKRQVSLAL